MKNEICAFARFILPLSIFCSRKGRRSSTGPAHQNVTVGVSWEGWAVTSFYLYRCTSHFCFRCAGLPKRPLGSVRWRGAGGTVHRMLKCTLFSGEVMYTARWPIVIREYSCVASWQEGERGCHRVAGKSSPIFEFVLCKVLSNFSLFVGPLLCADVCY